MDRQIDSCELSNDAVDDLKAIARYTDRTWGREQAELYRNQLEKQLRAITAGVAHTRSFLPNRTDLRVARCQRHYIFFLQEESALPLIVAVFHDRMDLLTRIKNRLGECDTKA